MFFDPDRIAAIREMICADTVEGRKTALAKLEPMQQGDFEKLYETMEASRLTSVSSIRRCQAAARAAHFNAVRQAEALNILHAERLKETRRKVLEQILTRAALQRGAQHVRAGGVVHKARAGLIFKFVRKEILNPIRLVHIERIDLRLVAAGHREQIAHRAGKQISLGFPASCPGTARSSDRQETALPPGTQSR